MPDLGVFGVFGAWGVSLVILWLQSEHWRQSATELTEALKRVSRVAEKLDERNGDTLKLAEEMMEHIRKMAL